MASAAVSPQFIPYGEGPPSPYIEAQSSYCTMLWAGHTGRVPPPPTLKLFFHCLILSETERYGEGPPSPYIEANFLTVPALRALSYGEGPPSPYIEARR